MKTARFDLQAALGTEEAELEKAKGLVHAIVAQAYIDVKRYWKYSLAKPALQSMPYHKLVQHNYLRREYERSIGFFLNPFEGYKSYMHCLLSMAGETDAAAAEIIEAVRRFKKDVDKFSPAPVAVNAGLPVKTGKAIPPGATARRPSSSRHTGRQVALA